MAGMLTQLLDVMNQQVERHIELHGLSLEEKDAIIQNDIDTLQKLVSLKNIVISQNNRLEKQRMSLVNDIAEVLGLKEKDMPLSQLISVMEGKPEQADIIDVGNRLKEAMEKLKIANDDNRELLQGAIDFVEYSLNALRSTIEPEPVEIPTIKKPAGTSDGASSFNATR